MVALPKKECRCMPDPITIGGLVAAAISAGAGEAGKAALGGAAKDAYQALKSAASRLLGPAVDQLEARPESEARAVVIAELFEEQPEPAQAELQRLAEALHVALDAEGRGATVDNRITVIASGTNAVAAGRDAIVGSSRQPRDK